MLLRRNNQDMLPMVLTLALSSGKLVGSQGVHQEEHYEPSPYRYEYEVHDDKVYLGFGAEEEGGGHGGGHRFEKSLGQEPFQRRPDIAVESGRSGEAFQQKPKNSVQSERVGKSHFEKQEENDFSGVFFGSSSRHSNSAPSEIEEHFQRRPSISPHSDRSGKSNLEKQEKPNFSQGFFGSTFGQSNSVPQFL